MPFFTYKNQILTALLFTALLSAGCSDQGSAPPPDAKPAVKPAPETTTAKPAMPESAPEESAATQPTTEAETVSETSIQAAAVDGQKIYQQSCVACHSTGAAGAPKTGDKAAWSDRIAKGNDVLFTNVKNGLNAMPPKGTCMSCSDEELRAAMEYIVGESS